MSVPRVSLVIPTYHRAGLLRRLLEGLAQQTLPPRDFEVILVADGCVDDTAAVVARAAPSLPYRLQFVEQPAAGAAAARNAGAALAVAPLLLFLDDDMSPAPVLLEAHLEAHAAEPGGIVLGYFPIPAAATGHDPIARLARVWWDEGFAARRSPGYRFGFKDFCTGNISLPAALFRAEGGFDPEIKGAGEDYELGYRLLRRGIRLRFAPRALSLHQDFNTLDRALRRARAEGLAHAQIVRRHPELAWSFHIHRLATAPTLRLPLPWRWLWRHPEVAEAGARAVRAAYRSARTMGLQGLAVKLYRMLAGHAYWQGARAGFGSFAAWERFLQDAPLEPPARAEAEIDLAAGPAALEAALAHGADAARLWWGDRPLGRIAPVAGAAPLSVADVRDAARGELAAEVLARVAVPAGWDVREPEAPARGFGDAPPTAAFRPSRVAQLDLAAPGHVWGLQGHGALELLVRNDGRPIARARLPLLPDTAVASVEELRAELERLGIRADVAPERAAGELPPVSVVVCTRDRPDALRRCLRALAELDYPEYEVVVVDNASAGPATADVAAGAGVLHVREDRPGLDWARNRGIAEARHDIVAYVDDDAVVDACWLRAIAQAFADPVVAAVTGLTLAAELATPAQHAFEGYGGMGQGMARRDFDGTQLTDAQKIAAHHVGVGANMAFRRRTFTEVGLFDTALDVGTPAAGAGDLDMFHRILVAGLVIRYEPAAVMWHYHRRDARHLRQQLYNNGRSFGVYLMKIWRRRSVPRRATLRYACVDWLGSWLLGRCARVLSGRLRFPVRLVLAEQWGALHAPWAFGATYRVDRERRALPSSRASAG